MKGETLRLAEALTEERTWESEGITVLCASVSLPQLAGKSGRARRFNRYYRRFCRAYFSYCAQVLFPEAMASCQAAMAVSAPWIVSRAALRHRVSYQDRDLLSIVCDARETCCGEAPFLLRRSEVWDLSTGLPLPIEEFFPPRRRCKAALLRFAREETRRRVDSGTAVFRENWRSALRRTLNTRNFFLSPEGFCFFYPMFALSGAAEGIVTFTMPYDAESGPFLPPQA